MNIFIHVFWTKASVNTFTKIRIGLIVKYCSSFIIAYINRFLYALILSLSYVFLFWSLSSHSRIFHSYGDVPIIGEGLQILPYAQHSWQLNIEVSLACHTYCDMGHPFIIVISEDPWDSHLLPSVWQWSCHYLFLRLRSVATGDWTPIPAHEANALPLRHRVFVKLNNKYV